MKDGYGTWAVLGPRGPRGSETGLARATFHSGLGRHHRRPRIFSKFLGGLDDVDFFIGSLLRGSGRGRSSQRSGQAFLSLKSGTHGADPWQGPTGEASFWGWWR